MTDQKILEELRIKFQENATIYAKEILGKKFKDFRSPEQELLLYQFMEPGNTPLVGILPTNSGKSLIYQAGSRYISEQENGKTVIISPLISLMMDQVAKGGGAREEELLLLKLRNDKIICFNSRITNDHPKYYKAAIKALMQGKFEQLYISPERFRSHKFLTQYKSLKVLRFVIDEAHCLELWGTTFRYEYKNLANIVKLHPKAKVVLLTASAQPELVKNTLKQLVPGHSRKYIEVRSNIYREELRILPPRQITIENNRATILLTQVKKWLKSHKNNKKSKVLIFSAFARESDHHWGCDELKDFFCKRANVLGLKRSQIEKYHAQMGSTERARVQNGFQKGKIRVLICTKAFGMGVDINDIIGVAHIYPPITLEEYYQEIGRGGRNATKDNPCESLLLWSKYDGSILHNMLSAPWDFRLLHKFMLLASGTLLIKPGSFSVRAGQRVEEWKTNGWLRKKGNISPLGEPLTRYQVISKVAAVKICNDILNRPNGNNGNILKDLRRVYRWLSLYCDWKNYGSFYIPPSRNPGMYQPVNSIKNDLAKMEDQFWIVQEPTHKFHRGVPVAVYSVAEKSLRRGQIIAFQQAMQVLSRNRTEAWEIMKKVFSKNDVWTYLRKNL